VIIVLPFEVDSTILTATDVVNTESDWSAGTYNLGDRAVEANRVYEVVAGPGTTDQPSVGAAADPPTWVLLGWSNQYRMFRDGRDSLSSQLDNISVDLEFGVVVTTVGALGLLGTEAVLTMTDPVEGMVYTETVSLIDIGVSDWWEYFFLPYDQRDTAIFDGIPSYSNATISIDVTAATAQDTAAVGRIVAGVERELGVTNYGTAVSILDYSTKERDGFGNLTLVPRRTVRLVDYDVTVSSPRVDFVVRQLEQISAIPALFVGDELYSSSVTFGVYRDFSQGITTPSISDLTIQVEGF